MWLAAGCHSAAAAAAAARDCRLLFNGSGKFWPNSALHVELIELKRITDCVFCALNPVVLFVVVAVVVFFLVDKFTLLCSQAQSLWVE